MNRRLLIIIASVIVLIGIGVGAFFLLRDTSTLTVGTPSNPFGSSGDRTISELLTPDGQPIQGAGTVVAPRLIRITDIPVAKGVAALYIPEISTGTTTEPIPADVEIRFIERQSGNIYAFRVHDRVLTRISNRTLPGIQDAVWTEDGTQTFARYLTRAADGTEHVETYSMRADGGEGAAVPGTLDPRRGDPPRGAHRPAHLTQVDGSAWSWGRRSHASAPRSRSSKPDLRFSGSRNRRPEPRSARTSRPMALRC